MAVDNTTIGSVLTIPDGLLKNLEKVDERLEKIQKKAKETEKEFNAAFRGMDNELAAFFPNLQKIVTALGGAAKNSKKMGENMGGAVDGVNKLSGSITAAIEIINKMRTLVQTPTSSNGNFMSHVSTLVDAISIRVSGMGTKFKDFKKQLLELDTAAMQQAMKAQSDAKIKLMNEQVATTTAKVNLEQVKQARIYKQAAVEAARLARAQAQLAQAQAMAATAQERATAANERAARRATIRQYGADATSAMSYVNNAANTGTFNQRAIAIKVLEEAIKNLNKTDKDYQKNLQDLSNRYRKLKSEQDRVVSSYREMQQHHRSLMDTTGQLQRAFALMFSVSQIRGYISQIAKVRGEFELQQRSLEAILQNKTTADTIFNKTVALAVHSPFQIKDLVSYTKQLAAYRIESDKLYDTTKRLADVSAGLGVDMQRLILAYGQVKAAAYLRGTEVRQFTEAGINLYGELQAYFKEVKGEAYTTAQIVDMISKRMVTFEDVEAIFKRITDQGGIFYNMQAIQAETLQGKIANLKDSIDIMLNDIGKANEGAFKGTIDAANVLIRNWEALANVGKALVAVLLLVKLQSMKTGITMTDMFLRLSRFEKLSSSTKGIGVLAVAFKNVAIAAESAGKMITKAFIANKALIGWTAVVAAIISLVNWLEECQESYRKIAIENGKLSKSFITISNAFDNASKNNTEQALEDKKKELEKLKKLLEKEGLSIKVNIDTENNIDEYFNTLREKYAEFLKFKRTMENAVASNNSWWEWGGLLGDNLDKDVKDFTNAYNTIISMTSDLDAAVATLYERYDKLNAEQRKILDEGTARKQGQTEIEYLRQQSDAVKKVTESISFTFDESLAKARRFNNIFRSFLFSSGSNASYDNTKAELVREINSVIEEQKKSYTKADWEKVGKDVMRRVIKGMAADKGWTDEILEIFYKEFNIPVNIDKESGKREAKNLLQLVQNEFDKKKIKVKLTTDLLDPDSAIKQINDITSSVEKWKTLRDNIKRGSMEYWNGAMLGIQAPMKIKGWKGIMDGATVFSKDQALRFVEEQIKIAQMVKDKVGGKSKQDTEEENAQRDLLRERIEAYKELQSQYEKYLKMYDKDTAKTKALESLRYKLQNAGIYGDAVGIFPDEKTIAEKIKGLAAQYKELSKRGDAYKIFADLLLQIDQEKLKKELDAAKEEIDDAFSGLNVYTDLKKLGLSESDIANMFGELPKTFDDVQKKINEIYNGKEGTEWIEKRKEAEKKLQEQIIKYNLDTFKELTKAYGKQLDEQLQLDNWYFEERRKIQDNEQLKKDPDLREQYLANLNKQYEKKTQENMWSQFKGSEMYVHLFENLDNASSFMLNNMLIRLKELKASMKQLDPTELKQITEHINKIMEQKNARNPFKALVQGIKEAKKATQEFNKLGGKAQYNNLTARQTQLISDISMQNEKVDGMQAEYDTMVRLGQAESEKAKLLKQQIADETEILKYNKNQLVVVNGQVMKMEELLILKDNAENKTAQAIQSIVDITTATAQGIESIFNAIGKGDETLSNAIGAFESIGTIVASIYSKNYAGIISGVAGLVTNLISMFNGDKARQKQIEDQQRSVEQLQRAYDKLTESINNSFNATDLEMDTNEAIENLRKTNNALYNMIALENDKKDTNQDQIQDWMNQIEDNREKMEELIRQQTEEMGGFGDKANYKSAAQEFADAWMDAYNSSSNTLEALQDKMDDYFDNLLKKQLMQRAAGKYFEAVFKAFDDAVAEGSAGGANGLEVTREELDKIKEIAATQSGLFDEYAKGLMEVLGVSPQSSTTLSQLQQGIQSLSESTGQALESLLNSIRFFVAQQSTDVAAIRQLLSATSNIEVSNSDNSPMLRELQTQTSYLSKMYSLWSSVIKSGGHPKNGAGIKVFQD